MRRFLTRFRNSDEFLDRYLPDQPFGGVFLPTRTRLDEGSEVILDIRMPALRDHLLIRGKVAWLQRGKRGGSQRAGMGIAFLEAERPKCEHLVSLAEGAKEAESAQRRHRRLPTAIRVDWRIPSETVRHSCLVDDIGPGGAFLRTDETPPEGTPVLIDVTPPGSTRAQTIEGRVAWTSRAAGNEGIGIEFRCRDIGGMQRLRELVRRIETGLADLAAAQQDEAS